jgi:hypothetical protein
MQAQQVLESLFLIRFSRNEFGNKFIVLCDQHIGALRHLHIFFDVCFQLRNRDFFFVPSAFLVRSMLIVLI